MRVFTRLHAHLQVEALLAAAAAAAAAKGLPPPARAEVDAVLQARSSSHRCRSARTTSLADARESRLAQAQTLASANRIMLSEDGELIYLL
jgi:hypothetical protein